MATKMRWADTYQAMTPIGQGFQNIAAGFFNGPGAGELEAARAEAEYKRAQMEKLQVDTQKTRDELAGRTTMGRLFNEVGRQSEFLPIKPRTGQGELTADPNAPVVAFDPGADRAAAQQTISSFPANIAAVAMRYGIDPSQAAQANALAKSSANFTDADRALAHTGLGKALSNYQSFSEAGMQKQQAAHRNDQISVSLAGKYFDAAQGNTANERKFAEIDALVKNGRMTPDEGNQAKALVRQSLTTAPPQSDVGKTLRDLETIKLQYGENSPQYLAAKSKVDQSQSKVTVEGARMQSLSNDGLRNAQSALSYMAPNGDLALLDKKKVDAIALADTYNETGQVGTLFGRVAGVDPAASSAALQMRSAIATKLYLQSGAAITREEAMRQASFYMPKVTDSYQVQMQKVRDLNTFFADSSNIAKIVNHGNLPGVTQPGTPSTTAPTQPNKPADLKTKWGLE